MKRKFNFIYFFCGCLLFCSITSIFKLKSFSEETLKINLNQELKKGNLLIGLKQYLGAKSDSLSQKNNISFTTKSDFLKLHSVNGIKHKSKRINIVFKKIPLSSPFIIERLVFGPFASYESAQRQAVKLKEKGFEVDASKTFADPV